MWPQWEEIEIAEVHHIYLCIPQSGQIEGLEETAPSFLGSYFPSKDN